MADYYWIGWVIPVGAAIAGGLLTISYRHPEQFAKHIDRPLFIMVIFVSWSLLCFTVGSEYAKYFFKPALDETKMADIRLHFNSLRQATLFFLSVVIVVSTVMGIASHLRGVGIVADQGGNKKLPKKRPAKKHK